MAFSPRIVGAHRPDYHSINSILSFSAFAGKQDEELVLALYDFFTSTEDGTWHFWPIDELQGQPRIRRFTSDPVKLLSNYGWHICGQSATIMYGLYTGAGLKARQFGIPGHLLCEVFYNDAWHILDVDMWTWFRNEQGEIASAAELVQRSQELIVDNRDTSAPCNLPDRTLENYAATYARTEMVDGQIKDIHPHWSVRSHQLDYHLRSGESLVLSEEADGAFICPDEWLQLINDGHEEWHGHPVERFEPFRTYANGTWTYAPRLTAAYTDVEQGCWEREGLEQTDAGLQGSGRIVFRLQSAYICTAVPKIDESAITYRNGAHLHIKSSGALRVHLHLEEKMVQFAVLHGEQDVRLDMTAHMTARYAAMLEFELDEGACLHAFTFSTPIMVAPKSLPKLLAGENHLSLKQGDLYGMQTVPWKCIVDFTPDSDPHQEYVSAQNISVESWAQGWKCLAPTDPAQPVQAVYRLDAPRDRAFVWFHALCSVKEGPVAASPKRASLSWSTDGKQWQLIKEAAVDRTYMGWDMSIEDDCRLDRASTCIYLRVHSETAITGVEFYGHLDMSTVAATALTVEHQWYEGDQLRTAAFTDPAAYTLRCGAAAQRHRLILTGQSQEREA